MKQAYFPSNSASTTRFSANRLLLAASILLFVSLSAAGATEIRVRLDRNPVQMNESFTLEYSAESSVDGEPDFHELEQNFEIVNQSHGSQMSINNGHYSRMLQWRLTLVPRRAGELGIPSVQFGRDRSEPVALLVESGSSGSGRMGAANTADLLVEVNASTRNPYVQSQLIYTVKVLRRVDFASADLSEPQLQDALIERLGDDKHYQATRDGLSYEIIERAYAVFPQKSGRLTIPPIHLEAQVLEGGGSRFGFFGAPQTRIERINSEAVELDVKPVPAAFSGKHWLPSEQLVLDDAWSQDLKQAKAGEPITRTLILRARGTSIGLLPELNSAPAGADAIRSYPDQPVLNEEKQSQGIVSVRQEKIVFVPEKAGEYHIPAIEIPWWNVKTGKLETARAPEQTLTVTGTGAAAQPAAPQQAQALPPVAAQTPEDAGAAAAVRQESDAVIWFPLAMLFGAGWIATLAGIAIRALRFRHRKSASASESQKSTPVLKGDVIHISDNAVDALKRACSGNDAPAARHAWQIWIGKQPDAERVPYLSGLAAELEQLDRCLYAKNDASWQGAEFWKAFESVHLQIKSAHKAAGRAKDELAPLHL
ncbi:BatD family protein [Candidatus Methylospira mobilis]|nr:BatD family protein [Candidatus Methylospira mobilis]